METNYCLGGKNKCKWRLEKIVCNDVKCFCRNLHLQFFHQIDCCLQILQGAVTGRSHRFLNWTLTVLSEIPHTSRFLVFTSWCNFTVTNSNQSARQRAYDQTFVNIFYSSQAKKWTKLHFLGNLLKNIKGSDVFVIWSALFFWHWRHTLLWPSSIRTHSWPNFFLHFV